ncbi:hypothetical protein [Arundinibacter roseus]|uniref:Outer membrane protein beta-barrel domain-containing protein n=1 Tax=Arundinibacter roseus TaxID=2070510 RepID=A0A4R4K0V1_9BACT|nr:hypothetical protein [Arundinibacter roseus]TDB60860.1 hypothetical protein EZE20_20670 [Arundinibacter roseus]
MKKTLLYFFLGIFAAANSHAQSPWRLGVGLGPSLSYNTLSSDRPLPSGKFEAPDRFGVSFDLSAERSLTSHLSLRMGVRTSTLKVGTRTSFISRDSTGAVSGWGRNNGYTQFSPANLNAGFTYNSRLLWRRLIVNGGADINYIINRYDGYVREKNDRKIDGHWPGDVYQYTLESSHTRNQGLSLSLRAGLDYKIGQYRSLSVQWLYNQGFRDLFTISTKELELNGVKYQANVVSKGSYLTMQVGYKQGLQWKKPGNYMSPYNAALVGKRPANRPDFKAGSAMVGASGVAIPYQTGGEFANVALRGGYFVADRILLGAVGFGAYSTIVPVEAPLRGWALGPMVRYHISTTAFSPFVEAAYLMGEETGQTYRRGWQFVALMPGVSFRLNRHLKADIGVYMLRPTYPVSENAVISLPQLGLHYSW